MMTMMAMVWEWWEEWEALRVVRRPRPGEMDSLFEKWATTDGARRQDWKEAIMSPQPRLTHPRRQDLE